MTQFYSRIDTEFNGDVYNIPFSYSKESEISVYLDDELFTGWYFLNESQIKFTELPSKTPEIVTIRRTTDITKKVVEYTNNTSFKDSRRNRRSISLLLPLFQGIITYLNIINFIFHKLFILLLGGLAEWLSLLTLFTPDKLFRVY